MKLFVVLFLFGLAAATKFNEGWQRERDDTMKGMKRFEPLRVALGMPDVYELDEIEDDIKAKIGEKLKDALHKVLSKIREILDRKEELKENILDKVKELVQKLKDLHVEVDGDLGKLLEKVKEKVKEHLKNLFDKWIRNEKVAIRLATELAEKKLIGEDDRRETRSIKDLWQKMKDFFKDMHIQLKEKWANLAEWLKEKVKEGRIVVKDKIGTMKDIAKEFLEHSKNVSKEAASELLAFLKPYKEDLGDLYEDVINKVKEILHKQE